MKDKFKLTKEQNIFLAKKYWDASVYCGMKMENRNVTFPQTKTILNGVNVPSVALDDIQAILNMRNAWKFVINNIDMPLTLDYALKVQSYVALNEALEWGKLRTGEVGITGVNYVPPIPDEKQVSMKLSSILNNENFSATDKALELFTYITKSQLFWDGNKRTALILANKVLINAGAGFINIADKDMLDFNNALCAYYEQGSKDRLKKFIYDNCITGIEFSKDKYREVEI